MTQADYALTVVRILQKERPDVADLDGWPEPWLELAQAGIQALDQGGDPWRAMEDAIEQGNGDKPAIRELLYAAAERLLSEPELELPPEPDCPPLPEGVQPDPTLGAGAGQWLDVYTDYAAAISPMTPRLFHVSAALWLAAVAIARRLKLAMAWGDEYPNLWICWLASTTLWRKSTGLNVARWLARRVFPHLMAAQDTTPEAFLSDLAGREPPYMDKLTDRDRADWNDGRAYSAQRGWLLDEMSGLLAGAGKEYNAGLVESLLRFYDCDPYFVRSTRGQGRVVVRDSYLSLLGASTPAAMAQHLTAERLWSMGWWPRFAILTPETDRPGWKEPREHDPPGELTKGVARLYERLPPATWPNPPETRTATLGAGVHETWARYNRALSYDLLTEDLDTRLHGSYGRLPVHALKVALILAALDGWSEYQKAPIVELRHLARAISITETWRASSHRALTLATKTDFDRLAQRVIRQVSRHEPSGATLRDVYRGMQDQKPTVIQETVTQLLEVGELDALEVPPGKNGGRPTTRYRIARGK